MSTHVSSSTGVLPRLSAQSLWQSPLVLAAVIFVLALWPRVLSLDVFVGPDEFYWLEGSAKFTQALANGDLAQTYHAGHPGVTLMWVETIGSWAKFGLNGFSDWPAAVGADPSIETLAYKRQAVGIANTLILVLQVLLVRQIFGSGVAWLAGFLLAFDPFLLTESRAVRTEGMLTSLSTLALLALLFYLAQPRLRYLILIGVLTGMAFLSKVSAVALLPIELLVVVNTPFWGGRRDTGIKEAHSTSSGQQKPLTANSQYLMKGLRSLLLWMGAFLLAVWLLWPALWIEPVATLREMYDYVAFRAVEGEGGGSGTFFWGVLLDYKELGPSFYPVVLLYRTGPALWLGLALLAVTWPTRWLSRPVKLAVGMMLLYLIPYLTLITLSELKFDRYAIPMLPALNIMAAIGLVAAWRWLTTEGVSSAQIRPLQAKIKTWAWLAALLVLGGQAALTLPHHPYYYTYWNPLLGGIEQAAQILPVGIGGEGLDLVAAHLNTLPGVENLKVATANSTKIRPLYRGKTIALDNLDGRWMQADYVSIYISQLQRGKHDPAIISYLNRQKPVHTVTLHGLEYAWLYPGPAGQYYGGGHKLEGRGTLFGYNLCLSSSPCRTGGEVEIAAGETLPLALFWRNEGQLATDRFFVRLVDVDGYIWAEAIAQPRPGFEAANQTGESIVESEAPLTLPVGMPPGDYFLQFGFRTDSGEIIGYFELPEDTKPIQVDIAKSYPATFQPPSPFRLAVNNDLALIGYNLELERVPPGANLWVTLYWQALTSVSHDYVILLRLLDQAGQEAAYWLGRPVRSGYPSTGWQPGQIVQDPWLLTVPAEAKPGVYRLEIALFDAETEAEVTRQILSQIVIAASEHGQ
ncbi:MAG: hypothetical protein Fur0044_03620 [Anaerolineae bacterium]